MIDTRLIDRRIDLKGLLFTIGGGLGKRKMLWELNPPGECFRSILGFPRNFHECFYNSRENIQKMSFSFREHCAKKERITDLLIYTINLEILLPR